MKIHCNSDHPDYHPLFPKCKVRLAGSERKNVVFADEERRYAIVHKLDENGDFVTADGMFVYEDFRGDVYIDCPPEVREQIEADRAGAAASPAYVAQESLPMIHIGLKEVSAAAISMVQAGRKEAMRHIIGKHGGSGLRLASMPERNYAACHAELRAELKAGPPLAEPTRPVEKHGALAAPYDRLVRVEEDGSKVYEAGGVLSYHKCPSAPKSPEGFGLLTMKEAKSRLFRSGQKVDEAITVHVDPAKFEDRWAIGTGRVTYADVAAELKRLHLNDTDAHLRKLEISPDGIVNGTASFATAVFDENEQRVMLAALHELADSMRRHVAVCEEGSAYLQNGRYLSRKNVSDLLARLKNLFGK